MIADLRIGFVGGGNMARSLLAGLAAAGHPLDQLLASDPDPASRQQVAALGAEALASNAELSAQSDVLVLGVKPQVATRALAEVGTTHGKLLISICAGLPIASILAATQPNQPIIRSMPNTPALVRRGVTALYASTDVSAAQRQQAEAILGAVGKTVWVAEEPQLDAVTALSGSGPAYFFYLMEALIAAGVDMGLEPTVAETLVQETASGAARLAEASAISPAELRAQVTSPGGTTEAALAVLSEQRADLALKQAFAAARHRSEALGRGLASKQEQP